MASTTDTLMRYRIRLPWCHLADKMARFCQQGMARNAINPLSILIDRKLALPHILAMQFLHA
jgi:hypothetical protein